MFSSPPTPLHTYTMANISIHPQPQKLSFRSNIFHASFSDTEQRIFKMIESFRQSICGVGNFKTAFASEESKQRKREKKFTCVFVCVCL